MKKILLLLMLIMSFIGIGCKETNPGGDGKTKSASQDDSVSSDAVVRYVQISRISADNAKKVLQEKSAKATIDSNTANPSASTVKATDDQKKAWDLSKADRENAVKDAAEKDKVANDAYALLSKLYSEKAKCHPVKNGHSIGQLIIWIMFVSVIVIFLAIVVYLAKNGFSLKDALSENTNDKATVHNPQYSAANIKEWLSSLNTANLRQLQDIRDESVTKYENAIKVLDKAGAELTAGGETPPEDLVNAKKAAQKVKDDAEAAKTLATNNYDIALKSFASSNSVNPAMLSNLSGLFPPTIDVSGGVNYRELSALIAASDKRKMAEAASQQVPAEINKCKLEEGQLLEKIKGSSVNAYRPSASRLIALISGLTMVVVAVGMVSFYLYFYLCTGCAPDLTALSTVLLALGFGMAPYVINKVANATTDKTL